MLVPLLVSSGCVHYRLGSPLRPAQALPADLAAGCARSHTNAPTVLEWQAQTVSGNPRYELALVKLAAPVAGTTTNKTLELEYYLPRPRSNTAADANSGKSRAGVRAPVPVVMILPVSAGAHYPLERHFARYFTRKGYAAVIVHRESEREPRSGQEINRLFRQSVLDEALVVDWLETRKELDARRIGVLGTSMGAIKGALFVAVEDRVKAAVLGLAGGDVPYILAYSKEGAWRGGGIVKRREAYLAEHHLTREEFRKELEQTVRYDPKAFAASVDPKKVMLILGTCDTIVPFKKGWELRRRMGKPETVVLMSGHYSAGLYLGYIQASAYRFFQRRFNEEAGGVGEEVK